MGGIRDWVRQLDTSQAVVFGVLFLAGAVVATFVLPVFLGRPADLERYAGVATAVGTLLGVVLSAWYTYETRRMVELQSTDDTREWLADLRTVTNRLDSKWKLLRYGIDERGNVDLAQLDAQRAQIDDRIEELEATMNRQPREVDAELSATIESLVDRWTRAQLHEDQKISRRELKRLLDDTRTIRQRLDQLDEDA